MVGLLAHALAALATMAVLLLLGGREPFSAPAFAAAFAAMLVDLDHISLPPYRTPFGHSLLFAPLWLSLGAGGALLASVGGLMRGDEALLLAGGVAAGYSTHLLLDAATRGGIFLFPTVRARSEWLLPLPLGEESAGGRVVRLGPGSYLVARNWLGFGAIVRGETAWKAWGRFPSRLGARRLPLSRDWRLNTGINAFCLLALAAVVVVM